jgi:predicted Fe-Mo cluster-binding NifX family protein
MICYHSLISTDRTKARRPLTPAKQVTTAKKMIDNNDNILIQLATLSRLANIKGRFMNIAITTTDSTLDSAVFYEFAQTPYLLIVNVDTMTCTPIAHTYVAGSDQDLARTILKYRCEAVITGKLSRETFDVLADDGVTRYVAANMSARAALEAMERRELDLIRNADGSNTCSGDHYNE